MAGPGCWRAFCGEWAVLGVRNVRTRDQPSPSFAKVRTRRLKHVVWGLIGARDGQPVANSVPTALQRAFLRQHANFAAAYGIIHVSRL